MFFRVFRAFCGSGLAEFFQAQKKAEEKSSASQHTKMMILLRAENRVFRSFGDAEFHHALRGDLDSFPGCGIAAHAGFAIDEHQFSETGNGERVFRVLVCERHESFDGFVRLFFSEPDGFSNRRSDL